MISIRKVLRNQHFSTQCPGSIERLMAIEFTPEEFSENVLIYQHVSIYIT